MMRLPRISDFVDERFFEHRRKSTSVAGMFTCALAIGLFAFRYYVQGVWSWDLAAVALAFVLVKYIMFVYYRIKD